MSDSSEEARSVVRQVRLRPAVWEKVLEKSRKHQMPAARLIAYAVNRAFDGSAVGDGTLDADIDEFRDLERRLLGR